MLAIVDAEREYAMKDPDVTVFPNMPESSGAIRGKRMDSTGRRRKARNPAPSACCGQASQEGYKGTKSGGKHAPFHATITEY